MKHLCALLLCLAGLFGQANAQQHFSMADAFLKRGVFTPANLRQLQWIPGKSQFTHVVNNKLVLVNAPDLKTDTLDFLPLINQKLTEMGAKSMEALPGLTWLNGDQCWFRTDKEIYTYSIADGLSRKNWFPAEAENLDIQDKNFAAA